MQVGVGGPSRPCELPEEALEPGLDWSLWLGAAPMRPYHSTLSPRGVHNHFPNWRSYREYSGGGHTDMGAHHFDIVQWALGRDETGPVEFIPKGFEGAEYHHYRYADGITVWRDKKPDNGHMIRFIGTEGEVLASRGKVATSPKELVRHKFSPNDVQVYESKNHRQNFIESILSRKPTICPASVGHRSATICQLAGIAERTGRAIRWDPATEQIIGDDAAKAMQDRQRRKGYEMPAV